MRHRFAEGAGPDGERTVLAEDWHRSAEVFADLADSTVMDAAWRCGANPAEPRTATSGAPASAASRAGSP